MPYIYDIYDYFMNNLEINYNGNLITACNVKSLNNIYYHAIIFGRS